MAYIEDIKWTHLMEVLQQYGDYFIQLAREDLQANRTNASYTLSDTMRTIVNIFDDRMEVDIELQDYWYYVEHGRRPGKFPPVNKIKEWIQVKPVTPYADSKGRMPTVDQLAWAIRTKIGKEGTKPQPFFEKNKKITYDHFKDIIAQAIDADIADYIDRAVIQRMYNMKFVAF